MVNFISYNSTGCDTAKTSWIRDLCHVTSADYVCLQEHFKKNSTVNKFFKEQFPDYAPFITPAHREKFHDSGRAMGGLAQLSSSKYKVKHKQLSCKSFRI